MGLEIVKFVMEVEEAFQFRISDEEAQQLDTPRRCLDFIHGRVPQSTNDFCLSQRAFYRLRRALLERTKCPKSWIRPKVGLLSVLPKQNPAETWRAVGTDLGAADRSWPGAPRTGWFGKCFGPYHYRIGDLVPLVIVLNPSKLFDGEVAWTRRQVGEVFHALIHRSLGIALTEHMWDTTFRDMGIG